jgi:hypothetical protein
MFDTEHVDRIFQRGRDAVRATVRLTSKITSGDTRESQQPITITSGDWPFTDNSR